MVWRMKSNIATRWKREQKSENQNKLWETTTNNFGTRLQDKIVITIFKGGKEQSIP
jgi:hypothetical protein